MKRCPECRRDYYDETLLYCLDDGTPLLEGPASGNEPATAVFNDSALAGKAATRAQIHSTEPPSSANRDRIYRSPAAIAGVIALLAIASVGVGYGIYSWKTNQNNAPASSRSPKFQRLTTSGKASDAGISPDGKYVAHVKIEAGQRSIWLRQVETTSDAQIVPPALQNFNGITFSKDGNYIYYVMGDLNATERSLYQIPALGGAARKLIDGVSSPAALSSDGMRFAFVRSNALRGESALVVANSDGTGERQVALRKRPNNFQPGGPSWSPDGRSIACAVLDYDPTSGGTSTVVEVDVETGAEKPITPQRWSGVGQVVWLPDGGGLALIGTERGSPSAQVWYVSYLEGDVRKISNDLNNYNRLSLSPGSNALVTVQTEGDSSIWVAPQGDAARAKQITSGRYDGSDGISWTRDGKIAYTSRESGITDIWIMDADGKNQKQLTANTRSNNGPFATADGRYIVFRSIRSGAWAIWRMDNNGGDQRQLTDGPADNFPRASPDGQWVVFSSQRAGPQRVRKVSINGGDEVQLTDQFTLNPTVSPDGSQIACHYREDISNTPYKLAIMPFAGGDPTKVLDLPPTFSGDPGLRWTPDGGAITFIDTVAGVSNIWSLTLDTGVRKQVTDFKSDQIFRFDWTGDGKQLALSRGTQMSDVVLIKDFK
jgi:Tol biopolymer transport system component